MNDLEKQQQVCKLIKRALYDLETANKIIEYSVPTETIVHVYNTMIENNRKLQKLKEKNNEK